MKKYLFAFFFLSISLLSGVSINIFNDSPFPLNANILSADGGSKGQLRLLPQQQIIWTDSSGDQAVWSQTPYTIIFTCSTGKHFGVYGGVSPGSLVTAMTSVGNRYCEPQKRKSS